MVRIVQSTPEIRNALAQLRTAWTIDAFVHNDVKLGQLSRHYRW